MITFLPLPDLEYICYIPEELVIHKSTKIIIWLLQLDSNNYLHAHFNQHQAIYFKYEEDMLAFKLTFGV